MILYQVLIKDIPSRFVYAESEEKAGVFFKQTFSEKIIEDIYEVKQMTLIVPLSYKCRVAERKII